MDAIGFLTIAAAAAGRLGFVYFLIFGQKSIPEWLRERKTANNPTKEHTSDVSIPPRVVRHNLPHRGDFIGREKEKKQVHEALKSRSFMIAIDGIGSIGKTGFGFGGFARMSRGEHEFPICNKRRAKIRRFHLHFRAGSPISPLMTSSTPSRERWNIHSSPNCRSQRNVTKSSNACKRNPAC